MIKYPIWGWIMFICFLASNCYSQEDYLKEVHIYQQKMIKSALNYEKKPPLKPADTARLTYFPINRQWRIQADYYMMPRDSFIKMPTTAGTEKVFKILGIATFEHKGKKDSLWIYQPFRSGLQPYLFIPFKDATSGLTSYGGGRYLEGPLTWISKDHNTIVLDFNKAYNPWCAYSDGYYCPLPPIENTLSFPVTAGEKKFNTHDRH